VLESRVAALAPPVVSLESPAAARELRAAVPEPPVAVAAHELLVVALAPRAAVFEPLPEAVAHETPAIALK